MSMLDAHICFILSFLPVVLASIAPCTDPPSQTMAIVLVTTLAFALVASFRLWRLSETRVARIYSAIASILWGSVVGLVMACNAIRILRNAL